MNQDRVTQHVRCAVAYFLWAGVLAVAAVVSALATALSVGKGDGALALLFAVFTGACAFCTYDAYRNYRTNWRVYRTLKRIQPRGE